jgi:phospholipid/cholesterol/gamma-HCH transport system permease protein
MVERSQTSPSATVGHLGGSTAALRLAGDWTLAVPLPEVEAVIGEVARLGRVEQLTLDASALGRWDSVLPAFLLELAKAVPAKGAVLVADGAPEGLRRLLAIALAVPPRIDTDADAARPLFVARVGFAFLRWWDGIVDAISFIGEVVLAVGAYLRGKAQFRVEDVARVFNSAGPAALPIVTLIGLLAGFILAFSGGNQLELFGAQIYIANLVTTGMAQEMGPLMAAVIIAGRTGAAFAAELGTMQVNQETDALRTLAVDPVQYLVVPRMLALMLMLPLLACYADLMGILGGGIIGVTVFDINPLQYSQQMRLMIGIEDFAGGIFKAAVFGVIVAVAGCLRGMRCGQDAAAVGNAATSAVVTSIVGIVVADAVINVLFHALGIR